MLLQRFPLKTPEMIAFSLEDSKLNINTQLHRLPSLLIAPLRLMTTFTIWFCNAKTLKKRNKERKFTFLTLRTETSLNFLQVVLHLLLNCLKKKTLVLTDMKSVMWFQTLLPESSPQDWNLLILMLTLLLILLNTRNLSDSKFF